MRRRTGLGAIQTRTLRTLEGLRVHRRWEGLCGGMQPLNERTSSWGLRLAKATIQRRPAQYARATLEATLRV